MLHRWSWCSLIGNTVKFQANASVVFHTENKPAIRGWVDKRSHFNNLRGFQLTFHIHSGIFFLCVGHYCVKLPSQSRINLFQSLSRFRPLFAPWRQIIRSAGALGVLSPNWVTCSNFRLTVGYNFCFVHLNDSYT